MARVKFDTALVAFPLYCDDTNLSSCECKRFQQGFDVDGPFKLYSPHNALLPFFFIQQTSEFAPNPSIRVYDCNNNEVICLNGSQFSFSYYRIGGGEGPYEYVVYDGSPIAGLNLGNCQCYYIVVNNAYLSERFYARTDMCDLLKIEMWHDKNIGMIPYVTGFRQRIWVEAALCSPTFEQYEEKDDNDRDGDVVLYQSLTRVYKFDLLGAPRYITEALAGMFLHQNTYFADSKKGVITLGSNLTVDVTEVNCCENDLKITVRQKVAENRLCDDNQFEIGEVTYTEAATGCTQPEDDSTCIVFDLENPPPPDPGGGSPPVGVTPPVSTTPPSEGCGLRLDVVSQCNEAETSAVLVAAGYGGSGEYEYRVTDGEWAESINGITVPAGELTVFMRDANNTLCVISRRINICGSNANPPVTPPVGTPPPPNDGDWTATGQMRCVPVDDSTPPPVSTTPPVSGYDPDTVIPINPPPPANGECSPPLHMQVNCNDGRPQVVVLDGCTPPCGDCGGGSPPVSTPPVGTPPVGTVGTPPVGTVGTPPVGTVGTPPVGTVGTPPVSTNPVGTPPVSTGGDGGSGGVTCTPLNTVNYDVTDGIPFYDPASGNYYNRLTQYTVPDGAGGVVMVYYFRNQSSAPVGTEPNCPPTNQIIGSGGIEIADATCTSSRHLDLISSNCYTSVQVLHMVNNACKVVKVLSYLEACGNNCSAFCLPVNPGAFVHGINVSNPGGGTPPVSVGTTPPVGSPPVSTPPVGSPPVSTPPVGSPPVSTPPVSSPPVSTPPVGSPPVSSPPVGSPPVSSPPVSTPPVGSPPVGSPPVGSPPVSTPPVGGGGVGTPPVGNPPVAALGNISVRKALYGCTAVQCADFMVEIENVLDSSLRYTWPFSELSGLGSCKTVVAGAYKLKIEGLDEACTHGLQVRRNSVQVPGQPTQLGILVLSNEINNPAVTFVSVPASGGCASAGDNYAVDLWVHEDCSCVPVSVSYVEPLTACNYRIVGSTPSDLQFGWSVINDVESVTNWQDSATFAFTASGTYFAFVRWKNLPACTSVGKAFPVVCSTTPPVSVGTTPPVSVGTTPPVGSPPVSTPPVGSPPVSTPPVSTPPVGSPPVSSPPVGSPPVSSPPVSTPPVGDAGTWSATGNTNCVPYCDPIELDECTPVRIEVLAGQDPMPEPEPDDLIGVANADFYFTNGKKFDVNSDYDLPFKITVNTSGISINGQTAQPSSRHIGGSTPETDYVISAASRSQGTINSGTQPDIVFYRFGFNTKKLRQDFPSTQKFRFDVYAKRVGGDPNNRFNYYGRMNLFIDCNMVGAALNNGVDWTRNPAVAGSFTDYPTPSPFGPFEVVPSTAYSLVGYIEYDVTNNTFVYFP